MELKLPNNCLSNFRNTIITKYLLPILAYTVYSDKFKLHIHDLSTYILNIFIEYVCLR